MRSIKDLGLFVQSDFEKPKLKELMQVFRGDQDWICNTKCLTLNCLLQKRRRLRKNLLKTFVYKFGFFSIN